MTVLFKLVPVGRTDAETLEVGTDECGPKYYVKSTWEGGNVGWMTIDWFEELEDAMLRVAGNVKRGVNYTTPLPATLAAVAVMAMAGREENGIGSGGTGARRQDAISGSYRDAPQSYDGTERVHDELPETSNVWRTRGL